MFKHFALAFIILPFISNLIFAETHIGGEMEGGVWDLEGSPYIVDETVELAEDAELIIEPGVVIQFSPYTGLIGENITFIAEGTMEDSIYFTWTGEGVWRCLFFTGQNTNGSFDYCYFYKSYAWWQSQGTISGFYRSLEVRNSTFRRCDTGIGLAANAIIEDCLFDTIEMCGVDITLGEDSVVIRRCVFSTISVFGGIRMHNGIVDHCTFINCNEYGVSASRPGSTVMNSIFLSCLFPFSYRIGHISNNSMFVYRRLFRLDSLDGVGALDRINANGDSTDRFGNMLLDPLLVGGDDFPDMYFLQEDSPCIDAGDPDSDPDPDCTRADIGRYFFPQQNIAVEPDTLEFIDIQTGIIDSLAVTILNIGLETLQVDSQFITPEGDIFGIGQGGDEFSLAPDSTHLTWIVFSPDRQAHYEAVLHIESNDRDESELEIPITGTSLGITYDETSLPAEFAIVGIYPNPFNSSTGISYTLPSPVTVTLGVYDLAGRRVSKLVDGYRQVGFHNVTLNAGDLPSGIYIVHLKTADRSQVRKVVLVR